MSHGRHRMNRRNSERYFSRGADRIHRKNLITDPMRGGIRL